MTFEFGPFSLLYGYIVLLVWTANGQLRSFNITNTSLLHKIYIILHFTAAKNKCLQEFLGNALLNMVKVAKRQT